METLPLTSIRIEGHLQPQNKKAALSAIYFPSYKFPVLGLRVHVTTQLSHST